MSTHSTRLRRAALLGSTATLVASFALGLGVTPVSAQDADESTEFEEVVVTGSRIMRRDLTAPSPVSTVGAEEFQLTGAQNVEQVLATLPQTIPGFGGSSNNPGNGTATVNLRGLGTQRTLVLVNGRRYLQSNQSGVVDLNTIPSTLIERVEVVTGGASAVYGSDALSGVVNFIMKDDFEGMEVGAQYDTTSHGDAEKYNIDMTMGGNFADGKGNATLYLGYVKRKPLFQGDRKFTTFALEDCDNDDPRNEFGVGEGLCAGGSSGVPEAHVFGSGVLSTIFAPDGSLIPWVNSGPNNTRFNYAPDNYLQLPQERWMASSTAHYQINDNVRAYTEAMFVHNRVPQELAPTPAFTTVEVNPDSPFFAPDAQAAFDAIRSDTNGDGVVDGDDNAVVFVGRRMVENGPRQSLDTRNGFRVLVGFDGEVAEGWNYDVSYSYARVDYTNLLNNDVAASRFIQAIAVTDDGTACQDPSGGCVPLNIWGAGNISQEAIDFVNVGAANVTSITTQNVQGFVSGSLGDWTGAGDVGLALGVEYRTDSSDNRNDEFLASGDVLGFNSGQNTAGSYDVYDIFGELALPLLSDVAGAESLEASLAARYSDYSTAGSVWSYAAGLTWAPIADISFRANYQRAVRAPNVNELFGGLSNGFPGATDPCAVTSEGVAPDASLKSLCEATGVGAGLFGVFGQANAQIEGLFGGNPDLQEETSDTWTFGAVFTPEALPGFTATIDYYKIDITDAIFVLGGGVNNVLDVCYNVVQDVNSPFCQAITRRADGNVDNVKVLNANIGALKTEGIDLQMNYSTDVEWGFFDGGSTLDFNFIGTHVMENSFIATNEGELAEDVVECGNTFGETCGEPDPEFRFNLRSTMTNGPMSLSLNWRWIGSSKVDAIINGDDPAGYSIPKLKSKSYFDLSGTYDVNETLQLYGGVRNLLNTKPQFLGTDQSQANTYPETYDAIGMRIFLGGKVRF
ncbi:TonB-dependent receptor [Kordiimonas sediminis]|uniref:TonB-dependent receptor n=1 Tax=Kordiimonas sediminis TaxID=1735581 RepID=A0A919E423_9PROT|nr:TonB-dependent receptor [Kordiimonas sediminis]GHF10365.1 TonB-dependent receptor [Kordiimonas sediminis]